MPLRLDIKKNLTARSDRVKCVDLHATEPWMLSCLYNGKVNIWNHQTQVIFKSIEVCDVPIRSGKFVARKNWIITGSDDMQIRVFNYNTLERIHAFEAHSDYIRCIVIHPTHPYILTCSDDTLIKLWNWEREWNCQQIYEGHNHYVMQIVINPKDNNTFASASLDCTIKVWQLGSSTPNFTLEEHKKGINCIDYYHGGEKPYLISGGDDHLIKIWDYQNKTCVQTLEGHAKNISCVCFHPELPIILTGSEDGTVKIWHANTYRLETVLNYGLERVWSIVSLQGSNDVALGYDEGSIMIKIGRDEPAISMDFNGKIIWAKHCEIQQANLKILTDIVDGERLSLNVKDLGSCEIYPQNISHNPNGRFVAVCGDGEYIIYTSMALRNKAFGSAQEFVWAYDSYQYAIREGITSVKVFKNFKEKKLLKPESGSEGIFGGFMLGIKSSTGFSFYDWENLQMIRTIDIQPKHVFWSENGQLVCLATDNSYYILRYNVDIVNKTFEKSSDLPDDGIPSAFEVLGEINDTVTTGIWIGDCFVYTNNLNRINYYVGGEIVTIAHLDRTMYIIGYISKDNRIYLADKEMNILSYTLIISVLEYQTAVMRKDIELANTLLPTIPKEQRTRIAHFLEKQGFKKQALDVSTDVDHKFELALQLNELSIAYNLTIEDTNAELKWRKLADIALSKGDFNLAYTCFKHSNDFGGLIMLATSSSDKDMLLEIANMAKHSGKSNVEFLCRFLLGRLEECLHILIIYNRFAEAAFFARSYLPSKVTEVVDLWKQSLDNNKIANALADPTEYRNLFPDFDNAVRIEQFFQCSIDERIPSTSCVLLKPNIERNSMQEMLDAELAGKFDYVPKGTYYLS